MASQELLLMLVMEVLKDQETANIVEECVLLNWVEVNCVLVLSIVTN